MNEKIIAFVGDHFRGFSLSTTLKYVKTKGFIT